METVTIATGLVSILLLGTGVAAIVAPALRQFRAIVCFASFGFASITILIFLFSLHLILENRALPSRSSVIARLQEAADKSDRAAVFSALQESGFNLQIVPESYAAGQPKDFKSELFSTEEMARSASYIWVDVGRLRLEREDLLMLNEFLYAEFLFDSQQRLIRWNYRISSAIP